MLDRTGATGLNGRMPAGILFANENALFLGAFALGMPEIIVLAVVGSIVLALIVGLVLWSKMKRQRAEAAAALEQQHVTAEATLKAEQARAATQAFAIKTAADAVAAKLADTEQRFSTHREVSDRRANDASQQISRLEAELSTIKEIAAQLGPTQSRIKDLETALAAEQGRMKAQELAIAATHARAADFEKRLIEAQELVMRHQNEMQQSAGELRKIRAEQAAYAAAGGPEAELAKAREATQQAEAKIAQLQKALKVAETRTEMVQKEFMNAVGVASAPVPGLANAVPASDKKMRELEEKLTHIEAEARKRAREDGYKIAELEYRLSEAQEAASKPADEDKVASRIEVAAPSTEIMQMPAPVSPAPAVAIDPPASPVETKTADDAAGAPASAPA